jgi:hypothetical protein
MDEKNGQVAHRRMVAGREILRNQRENNNSPETGQKCGPAISERNHQKDQPSRDLTSNESLTQPQNARARQTATFVPLTALSHWDNTSTHFESESGRVEIFRIPPTRESDACRRCPDGRPNESRTHSRHFPDPSDRNRLYHRSSVRRSRADCLATFANVSFVLCIARSCSNSDWTQAGNTLRSYLGQ